MKNRIKELRKAKRLTLQSLAGCVQTSHQHIHNLETGKRRLTVDWIERLAKALDCEPLALLSAHTEELNEQELLMLGMFRTLNEDQQKTLITAAETLASPSPNS